MEIKDIEKLAQLARIELTAEEKAKYLKEIGAILGYVDQIKAVAGAVDQERKVKNLRNVMRADEVEYAPGENTEALVAEFPSKEGNFLKVKKIL